MAQITSYQHSYSNSFVYLFANASATRTSVGEISITAEWTIDLTQSSYGYDGVRYLVLYIGSKDGTKYFSSALPRTSWFKGEKYTGSCVFENIPLDESSTQITIGFGVSDSQSSTGSNTQMVWNGSSSVTNPNAGQGANEWEYTPTIQFNPITDITPWYTPCVAPTLFEVSPGVFEDTVSCKLEGIQGGNHNDVTGYQIESSNSVDGVAWSDWVYAFSSGDEELTGITIERGSHLKLRIRVCGSAGESYFSEWKESNIVIRNSLPLRPTSPVISANKVAPGDIVTVSWTASTDIDDNHAGYNLAQSVNGGEYEIISTDTTTSRQVNIDFAGGDVVVFAVQAIDALGATSDWLELGTVSVAMFSNIYHDNTWNSYVGGIYEDSTTNRCMAYIYENGSWHVYS